MHSKDNGDGYVDSAEKMEKILDAVEKRESLKTRERDPFSGRGYAHTTVMKNDDDDTTKKVNALLANVCAF